MASEAPFCIEPATERDVPVLLRLIKALAEYEKLGDRVIATEASLAAALFGPQPYAEAVIARAAGEPVGIAVFFHTFSTFRANRVCIWKTCTSSPSGGAGDWARH